MTAPPEDFPPLQQSDWDLDRLERQMERSQLFAHTALGESFTRLRETETFLYAAIELLLAKGLIQEDELREVALRIRQELAERGEYPGPGTVIRLEDSREESGAFVPVDCSARMPICHSICCKLDFALSIPEIETGKVKWDLGRPYYIRHEDDGYCTHRNRHTGDCGIYADRPAVCRGYSCAYDERIWKDFEKMELNTEWIEAHLSRAAHTTVTGTLTEPSKPRLIQVIRREGKATEKKKTEDANEK